MLFDTTSPGRKRAVQVIFSALAILMAAGMIFFGIGSSQSVNPIDFLGGGGTTYEKDAKKAQKALKENPKDVTAALALAKARAQIATDEAFDPTNGEIAKDGGQEKVDQAVAAWQQYMKLGPAKPDASTAMQYAGFFALPSVAKYDQAARAIQAALVTREPTSGLYAQLAIFQLVAGDNDAYKQARAKALELAPNADRRTEIKDYLDSIKEDIDAQQKQIAEQADQSSGSGDSADGTTPKLPTLPTLQ